MGRKKAERGILKVEDEGVQEALRMILKEVEGLRGEIEKDRDRMDELEEDIEDLNEKIEKRSVIR